MKFATSKSGTLHRFFGTALICAAATWVYVTDLKADELTACPTLEGNRVIVRLTSGVAFALPFDGVSLNSAEPDPKGKTDVQYGCPENPIISRSIILTGDYARITDANTAKILSAMGVIQLQPFVGRTLERVHIGNLQLFDETAERIDNCKNTSEGVLICYHCREDVAVPGHCVDLPHSGVSSDGRPLETARFGARDPQNLVGSSALPWLARCSKESSTGRRLCTTAYELQDGIDLRYSFGRSVFFDVDALRAMDMAAHRTIQGLRAPEFDGDDLR